MKIHSVILALLCSISIANGQSWENVGNGLDGSVDCLTTYNGNLIATGIFSHSGIDSVNNMGFYNGIDWTGPDSSLFVPDAMCMIEFNDTLFAAGLNKVYYWNNSNWVSYASIMDGYWVSKFIVYKDQLYLSGSNHLYKLENGTFDSVISTSGGIIQDLCIYKNILFLSGCFMDIGHHVAGFDGTSIINVNAPFTTHDNAASMASYNGILYIGGDFDSLQPKYLYQFDGFDYSPATYQPDDQALMLDSLYGKLFMHGYFTHIGSQNVNMLAYWDGSTWTNAGQGFTSLNTIDAIAAYDSAVYIGGNFIFNDGTNQASYIARFVSNSASITTLSVPDKNVSVYPNPATDFITIQAPERSELEIYNITGQMILKPLPQIGQANIDISELDAGVYIISVKNDQKTEILKFVKE